MMKSPKECSKYFITTPIFYVNASPHIGHLHSALLADAANRFQKLLGKETVFTTGTDEHGLKIQKAAEQYNYADTKLFCNDVSQKYSQLFSLFSINHSDFIRTSEDRHKRAVTSFWNSLKENGHIRKTSYGGWYCVQDETFLTERQILEISGAKISSESGHPVEWCEEENYVFDIGKFSEPIRRWLDENDIIRPSIFRNHLQYFLDQGDLQPDLSISRPRNRLHWGIPVPEDPNQTIYVWLDALVNYLTAAGYPDTMTNWPPDCHVIGKDILKFHAIYWPAFLMAANLDLPKRILCHSHWTVDDTKMSKSKGNVVDPIQLIDPYTTDGVRYFLLRDGVPHSDGNFNPKKMINYLNAELCNTLGNLLSRLTSTKVNHVQRIPQIEFDIHSPCLSELAKELLEELNELPHKVKRHYAEFDFYLGIDAILKTLIITNNYIQHEQPWVLKKTNVDRLNYVLLLSLESLRISSILMQPIVPNVSTQLMVRLGIPNDDIAWCDAEKFCWETDVLKSSQNFPDDKRILFDRINK